MAPRSPNGFLSSLTADDFELVRPHLRTVELPQELVLVEVDELLKRAYLPHRGVISLVVKLARGENVQIAMVGRDSIFGSFSALGDAVALNSAVVLVPGMASTIDIDQLRYRRPEPDVPHHAGAAWTGGLRADPANRRLQRLAYGGVTAGTVSVADA